MRLLLLLPVVLAGSQAEPRQPVLGFTECSPALFRRLPTAEVAISITNIAYDSFGRVTSFQEELRADTAAASSHESSVSVLHDPQRGSCANMKYGVEVAGRKLASATEAEFKTAGLDGHFAFKMKDLGGVVVIGSLDSGFETSFSYDSFGRRQLARQIFTYAGSRYEVTYPTVTFDKFGRLSGYQAVLKRAPEK